MGLIRKRVLPVRKVVVPDNVFTAATSGLPLEDIRRGEVMCQHLSLNAGTLEEDDVFLLLRLLGRNPSDSTIEAARKKMSLPPTGSCNYDQFCHIWMAAIFAANGELLILQKAFPFFDQDGSGFITREEMISQFAELGGLLTEDEIQQFHDILDVDKNGVVDYAEFIEALQSQTVDTAQGGSLSGGLTPSLTKAASRILHAEQRGAISAGGVKATHPRQPSDLPAGVRPRASSSLLPLDLDPSTRVLPMTRDASQQEASRLDQHVSISSLDVMNELRWPADVPALGAAPSGGSDGVSVSGEGAAGQGAAR